MPSTTFNYFFCQPLTPNSCHNIIINNCHKQYQPFYEWCDLWFSLPLLKALQSVAISSNDTLRERLQNFFDNQWPVFIWGGHNTHQGTWQCIHELNNMHCWPSFIGGVKLLPRRPTDQPVSRAAILCLLLQVSGHSSFSEIATCSRSPVLYTLNILCA